MLLHNVDFKIADGIGFYVTDLAVTLEPEIAGEPIDLDRIDSFVIRLHQGEALLTPHALASLFNRHVLDYRGRPLRQVKIPTRNDGSMRLDAEYVPCEGAPGIPSSFSGTLLLSGGSRLV
jgi:hypothetical protein